MVSEAPHGQSPPALPEGGASGASARARTGASQKKLAEGEPEGSRAGAEPDEGALPLRLALTRGALGIELNRPERVGPLEVVEFALSLPGLRYPLDLSKGVKQFRNRRGQLQRLVLRASLVELGQWLRDRWTEVLGEPLLGVRLWKLPQASSPDPLDETARGLGVGLYSASRSLAFDLSWCPQEQAAWVLERPRGLGLDVPALAVALRALDALSAGEFRGGEPWRRRGRVLELEDVPGAVARAVLPNFGCRVPDSGGLRASRLEVREGRVELSFDSEHEPPELDREVLLALAAASQLRDADDFLARGEDERARGALLDLLGEVGTLDERSGLRAAVETLAELDVVVPGRQEAALATLEEAGGAEAMGVLGAEVLAAAGHVERAREALARAGEEEPFPPLAAQLLCRAAQLADHTALRVACLDRAVARAPHLASARWLRFEDRVRRGDVEGALADAQHLEAAAATTGARHAVCLRAGRRLADAEHREPARRLLERALRYAPDDPAARAALGRLFAALGLKSRALSLLQAALQADAARGEVVDEAEHAVLLLDLGRLLGDGLDDLPQAIARLRQVSARSPHAVEARALEATYCERLGDVAGASRAYARLREAVELGWASGERALEALTQGARFEEQRNEMAMAERHLYAALSLAPSNETLRSEYRRVAALALGAGG